MASAKNVAEYLLWLAAHECEDEPEYLTPLKLQKLLYYVQGWTIAERGEPMFGEPIEAWKNGPVVRALHNEYKHHGQNTPIMTDLQSPAPVALPAKDRALVHSVWDAYKQYSGIALRDMTHYERPYAETYTPRDTEGRCERTIEVEKLRETFAGRAAAGAARLAKKRDKLQAFARANTRRLVGRDTF